MSNLSNLMISGSYYGLINLQDSTQNLASQSGDVQLQDGVGDNIGLTINATTKEFTVVNNFKVDGNSDFNGDVDISGSLTHTGSIDIVGDLTIQGDVTANVGNFDTVNARLLNITEESASVIFSSGSNVLGDEETDRQDLIGQVIVSGTLGVEGNSAFTGSLTVSNEISSSTVNGIGNVTSYSSSVDDRLVHLEVSSGSQDSQLSNLENFTASQENINSGYNSFTSSQETLNGFYNQHTQSLNDFTSSQLNINSGYNTFTSSADSRLDNIEATTASLQTNKLDVSVYETDSASFDSRIDNIEVFTSSLATTFLSASIFNAYTESQDNLNLTFATTGSNTFSGSINGEVTQLSIVANTASMDCSLGNFFNLSLVGGADTHLKPTNIQSGQTITIRVNQVGSPPLGTISSAPGIEYSVTSPYTASAVASATDVVAYVTFDENTLYGSAVKRFI